jgi:protein disulfide-isomerase A1
LQFAGNPIAIIFAEQKEERAQLVSNLRPVAEATKGQIIWVTADPIEYAERASQVALKPGKWPAFAIEDGYNEFKFAFSKRGSIKDLSESAMRKVVDDFLAERLESSIKSDQVPTPQEGPVTNVVADSFEEVIINNEKDALVLFYSLTCRNCKAIAPSYDELGDLLKPYADRITVAKIDATSNDVWPRVSSFPTVKLFKSGSKDEPITYKGNRTVDDFVKFVKDNGSQGIAEVLGNILDDLASKSLHDEL